MGLPFNDIQDFCKTLFIDVIDYGDVVYDKVFNESFHKKT